MPSILFDDFKNIGRGVDIEGLKQVVLILPLHYQFDAFLFNKSEFVQILGRVGRFRKVGHIELILVDIEHDFKDNNIVGNVKSYIEDGIRMKIEDIKKATFDDLKKKNKEDID